MIQLNRLKGGKKFAVTMSYDDGTQNDRRLVELFDQYGIRGTFHLNSGTFARPNKIQPEDFRAVYKNHEIACHGEQHLSLQVLPYSNVIQEILEDRRNLEEITGQVIRGMSYANGSYNDQIIDILSSCGIVYARTIRNTNYFNIPDDFMAWHPTCHHRNCLELGKTFLEFVERKYYAKPGLLYVWGHSYEFATEEDWAMIEAFCKLVGGRDDIWYATNMEIYEYVTAQRQLVVSVNNKIVYNPTAQEIWFADDDEVYSVKPGETIKLD